jgi:hypothetical protein
MTTETAIPAGDLYSPFHPNPVVREALMPALYGLDNVMLVEPMAYGAFARTAKAIEHMFGFGGRPVPFGNGTTTGG